MKCLSNVSNIMILSRNIPNLIEARCYHSEYRDFSRLSFGVAVIMFHYFRIH